MSEFAGLIISWVKILTVFVFIVLMVTNFFRLIVAGRDCDREAQSQGIHGIIFAIIFFITSSFATNIIDPNLESTEEATETVTETEDTEEDITLAEVPEETETYPSEQEKAIEPEIVEDVPEVRPHFSIGSFVLGGFCISAILGALGFVVVYANKKHEEEQNEEEPEEKSVKTMTYDELINKWCNKAELFHDNKIIEILKNISNDLRDLDIYHGRGLIEDSVVERVYNIYLEDLPKYYNTYCNYIDIDTPASKNVISSIKENLEAIHSTLRNAICVEIDKDAVMTDMQIDASRTSLNAIASQHGYAATSIK